MNGKIDLTEKNAERSDLIQELHPVLPVTQRDSHCLLHVQEISPKLNQKEDSPPLSLLFSPLRLCL